MGTYDDVLESIDPPADDRPILCERCKVLTDPDNLESGLCSTCGMAPVTCKGCGEAVYLVDVWDSGGICGPCEKQKEQLQ